MNNQELNLNDANEPRFEWPAMLPSPSTTATTSSLSHGCASNIYTRVHNLELLVSDLLTRIIELEKSNTYYKINTTYDWSSATKNNILNKQLNKSKSDMLTYFSNYKSN